MKYFVFAFIFVQQSKTVAEHMSQQFALASLLRGQHCSSICQTLSALAGAVVCIVFAFRESGRHDRQILVESGFGSIGSGFRVINPVYLAGISQSIAALGAVLRLLPTPRTYRPFAALLLAMEVATTRAAMYLAVLCSLLQGNQIFGFLVSVVLPTALVFAWLALRATGRGSLQDGLAASAACMQALIATVLAISLYSAPRPSSWHARAARVYSIATVAAGGLLSTGVAVLSARWSMAYARFQYLFLCVSLAELFLLFWMVLAMEELTGPKVKNYSLVGLAGGLYYVTFAWAVLVVRDLRERCAAPVVVRP